MFKDKNSIGLKGYLVLHKDNDAIIGDLTNTPEVAYRKLLGLTYPENYRVVQVQIIDELNAHICFCKQHDCGHTINH